MNTEQLPEDILQTEIDKYVSRFNHTGHVQSIAHHFYYLRDEEVDNLQRDKIYWQLEAQAKSAIIEGLKADADFVNDVRANNKILERKIQEQSAMTPTESMGFNDRGETFPDKEPKQPISDRDIDELAEKEYPFGGMCVSQVKRAFKKGIKLNNILLNEALSIIDELINKAASVKDTGNAIKRAKNFLLDGYKATQPIWIDIMQIDSKWDEYSHFITEINEHWKYMTRAEFIKAVTELLPNNNQSI